MRQQRDADAWVAALDDGTPVVGVPVLGRKWRRVRGWIEGGMASGTPAAAQARVWCAYARVSGVLDPVGQRGTGIIAVLVAGCDGLVRVVARGAPAPAAVGAVKGALRAG
ncbi:MAG: hypothetical protein FJW92_08250 [Actinobacteria bacterium]|nr:hypothetical protein [Actinomycetota bacterium]